MIKENICIWLGPTQKLCWANLHKLFASFKSYLTSSPVKRFFMFSYSFRLSCMHIDIESNKEINNFLRAFLYSEWMWLNCYLWKVILNTTRKGDIKIWRWHYTWRIFLSYGWREVALRQKNITLQFARSLRQYAWKLG